ncbi:hypothetical protein GCM10010460_18310 [Microbacterium terrae]|uniref:Sortase family protein n=2 Tax=Microbacterium terrae TaxID=69369 RepID=A0A0M2HG57_9MICO|nr:Sortase family protein [Microbacterium terrae]GLJ97896.1 hypothetical protein GCM10017594_10930 [Microbacterium terrae]
MPRAGVIGTRAAGLMVAAVLAASLVACGSPGAGVAESAATSSPTTTPRPAATPAVDVPVTSAAVVPAESSVAPTRLEIDAIGVHMPVAPVGVDDSSQMELPEDPAVAGWYRFGPDAVSTEGHMVLSAHVDAPAYPIGPLARLRDLTPGGEVVVVDEHGATRAYRVESVEYHEKAQLPTDEIFRRDGASALVIITCGGPFDSATGRYRDNVVAVALPIPD